MIGPRFGATIGPRIGPRMGLIDPSSSAPALTIGINDSADPVTTSTNFNYTVVVTNIGAAQLASVSAIVGLHSSLTFVSGSGTGWTVGAVGQTVTCTRATLDAGAAPTITITVTAGALPVTATTTADATATGVPSAPRDIETTTINAAATTLTVAINDSADPVNVSIGFSYTIVVTNTGAAPALSVSSVMTLDASLAFVSGSGTGWTVTSFGQVITCTRASLAVGAAPTITLNVTAGSSALTASTTADANASNAPAATQDTETTRIRATTTLSLALDDSADPVNISTNYNYTLIVTNGGAADAETVSAVVVLDASLTFVSGSGTGWTVNNASGTVTCTRATLAAGAGPTITITVTAGGSALTASTTANASSANTANATQDTETTVIRATTTLTVALTDNADPVITTAALIYSLVVTNTGSASAATVSAPVVLDSSLTFVSGSGTGWTVSAAGQTVTCSRATLAVGAAPTVTINVTTGGSALTASSTGDASADNAAAATTSTQTTVVKLVAIDATSLIRVPASSTQWSDFNAYNVAISTPNFPNVSPASLWLLQEASGNPTDSIGSITLSSNMPSYQQTVTGWTRKAIVGSDGSANQKLINSTTAPNPLLTSTLLYAIVSLPATPSTTRDLMCVANNADIRVLNTGKLRLVAGANSDLANVSTAAVRPVILQINLTALTSKAYTNQEKISGTFALPTSGTLVAFGGHNATNSASGFLYAAEFTGASAELTDNQVKSLLSSLNWSIPW